MIVPIPAKIIHKIVNMQLFHILYFYDPFHNDSKQFDRLITISMETHPEVYYFKKE